MIKPFSLLVLGSLLFSGCSLIPAYQQPQAPVPHVYPLALTSRDESAAALDWREFFADPALHRLIEIALANNRDIRVAVLNVEAYQARYRIRRADLLPDISAAGSGTRQRVPADLAPTDKATIESQYSVGLNVSYELDLFGRVRSLDQEALQRYLASEQAQHSAHIGLIASVASAWLTLQADQALERLTSETLDTYENSYQLTRRSAEVGTVSDLALSQSQTLVQSARGSMARYRRQVAEDRNLLALLIGGEIPADLVAGDWERQYLPEVTVGLPSDLLSRRPDILEAEFLLKAANADIGAARAAFFPRISLTAGAGSSSEALSGLFNGGAGAWSFFPQISLPIFNAGRLQASLDVTQIEKDIQVARYEKAIQSAFREVSDGLAATETFGQQIEAQQGLVSASAQYYRLAQSRFLTGIDSSLTLLDAQRTLFAAQQALISDQLAERVATIDLFKALGGGWKG
jgi:multidrug efflux system outer membrane protein